MSIPVRLNSLTTHMLYRYAMYLALYFLGSGLAACTTKPYTSYAAAPQTNVIAGSVDETSQHPGLSIARDMIGVPYRYGGASPQGFDCSGLIFYSYRKAGFDVPRTSVDQYRMSHRVAIADLKPGDLIFFRLSGKKPSHVGIYNGNGQFVHAPSTGKQVSYASLDNPFWNARIIGAGRFL